MAGPLGAADASPRVTDAGAAGRASAFPQIRQAAGIQMAAQNAGQPPVVSATSSLKELAHADTAFVKETIGRITQDLTRHVTQETGRTEISAAIAQHLVNEGVELQILAEHSARFANQSQAKIWALRVLSWIGSVVTLGALPRLAQLIAPKSDFTDSLSRYLLGNGPEVGKDKLEKFDQLFEKFRELNTLTTRNAELEQQFYEARKVPESLQGVLQQLIDCQKKRDQVAERGPLTGLEGEARARYLQMRTICREILSPIEGEVHGGADIPISTTLDRFMNKLGLPENADTAAIRVQVQNLSDEFKGLDETMRSGEGRYFNDSGRLLTQDEINAMNPKPERRSLEESVRQQAQNVHQCIRLLKQGFEDLEAQTIVLEARAKVATIEEQRRANGTAIADASSPIRSSILELGPEREIPKDRARQAIVANLNKIFQAYFVDHTGDAAPGKDTHWTQDYQKIAKELLEGGGIKCVPEVCWLRKDALRACYFTLQIGNTMIDGREILDQNGGDMDKSQAQIMQKIVDAVRTLAEQNKLEPVVVLGNLLRTYQGQTAIFAMPSGVMEVLSDYRFRCVFSSGNYNDKVLLSPERITINADGSCRVVHGASLSSIQIGNEKVVDVANRIPCNAEASVVYESSLEDFTCDRSPHIIEDQCAASGRCLDVSAMM